MVLSSLQQFDRLAQLVERYIDIVEVTSSSLVSVTTRNTRDFPLAHTAAPSVRPYAVSIKIRYTAIIMEQPLKDIVIIYHGDCRDGFGAAYAAWKKFGNAASYLPWKDHRVLPEGLTDKTIYIADFSFREPMLGELIAANKSVVVLDHHQSAETDVRAYPQNIFDNNHSGAVLAWQYFYPDTEVPELLRYIEDHDLWRFALPENREYNVALGQYDVSFETWDKLITELAASEANRVNFIARGALIATFEDKLVETIIGYRERVLFEGYEVWAVNASRVYRSIMGNQLAELNEAAGDIALGIVYYHSNGGVNVSLRSKGDVDVAAIAERYGGGGHKHAASIKVSSFADLPFTFL